MGHLPEFIAYDETTVEQTTQHYACLISAAMVCATYYGCADYSTLASDYKTYIIFFFMTFIFSTA